MKYNLSELSDLIRNRRTIYPEFFSSRKIHKEQIELILNNAIWAPNHGLTQPWKFNVYLNDGLKLLSNHLSELYKSNSINDQFNELIYEKFKSRPLISGAVIIVSLKRDTNSKISELEEIQACTCAIQNILLTSTAWGLGSFWSTPKIINSNEMKNFLTLNEQDKCLGIIYLGYLNDDFEYPKSRRKPIEYYTEWNEK